MLRLPSSIEVQLVDEVGDPLREADVLVAINLLAHNRYYYGNLVGLTDATGRAAVQGEQLERHYAEDQAAFPMDYKLELIECDDTVELSLLSDEEITAASSAISDDYSVPRAVRESYARARNMVFAPALVRIVADSPNDGALRTTLSTRRMQ